MNVATTTAVTVLLVMASTAWAGEPAVTVTATPMTLTLCPKAEAQVMTTVRNGSNEVLHNLCLMAFTNGPLAAPAFLGGPAVAAAENACAGGAAFKQVPADGAASRILKVSLTDYPATSTFAYLWASYQSGTSNTENQTAAAAVEIKALAPPGADAVKLEVKTGFSSLHEDETGRITLTISNTTNEKLLKVSVLANSLDGATVTRKPSFPVEIAAQSTVAVDLEIKADGKLQTGKSIALIEVDATTSCGFAVHRVASYEVTLGVFGQSELLTLIGIPSLLFLPGFLMMTLWLLLWRLNVHVSFLRKSGTQDFVVSPKEAEFWLLGISLSLAMFEVAPRFTQLGYRRAYNLADIAILWVLSLGIGLVVYLVLVVVDHVRARIVQARKLTADDAVLDVLKKIKRRGLPRALIRPVQLKSDPDMRGFRLWKDDAGVWVIPQIQYGSTDVDLGAPTLEISELLRRIEQAAANHGFVGWAVQSSSAGRPRLCDPADLADAMGGELVVKR